MALSPRQRRYGAAAIVLLALGIVFAGLYRVVSGAERHSYSAGAVPRSSVHVTSGESYQLAVPGGVHALERRDVDPSTLQCEWSTQTSPAQTLAVDASGPDTKATDTIATFTAPVTGDVHIDCTGWGVVFVDDADNASGDPAGLFLLLCVIALTLGAGLGLSALRSLHADSTRGSARAAREDEEIERLVHLVHIRSEDGEVAGGDGDDVAP